MYSRGGDDIASAVVRILEEVIKENPDIKDITTWSDSCVPQNRTQMISYAMLNVLRETKLNSITMKYSVPDHSCVQEVDIMHSNIERAMHVAEFYSPASFLRVLLNCHRQRPYKIMQMQKGNFKTFSSCSSQFDFKKIPFSKVVEVRFSREYSKVKYKTCRTADSYTEVDIIKSRNY